MQNKITALLKSRRFWIALAGVVAIVFNDQLGIPEEEVNKVAAIVIAWVLGDSYRQTT